MSEQSQQSLPPSASYDALSVRIHGLADTVQKHDTSLSLHGFRLDHIETGVRELVERAATREQLDSELTVIQGKLDNIAEKVGALMAGARWLVITVLGAIVIAMMGFAMRGGFAAP